MTALNRRPRRWLLALVFMLAAHSGSTVAAPDPSAARAPAPPAEAAVDASGQAINLTAVIERLRAARYVLLGEIHDNPEHHRLRAALLRALLADGVPTRVVFEQIDRQHNAAVEAAPRDTDAVVAAGRLDQKGWAWPLHRPLFDAALEGGATVRGGNLSRSEASGVARGGVAQAPPDLRRYLTAPGDEPTATDAPWTAGQNSELYRQVDEGHCGALPPKAIPAMALAQRARDAALASAMTQPPPVARVVLIAGNGHVRRDIGVPHYLAVGDPATPAARVRSIGFLERAADGSTAVDGPYDEAWFTTRVERPDPCESFRAPAPSKPPV